MSCTFVGINPSPCHNSQLFDLQGGMFKIAFLPETVFSCCFEGFDAFCNIQIYSKTFQKSS